MLACTLKLAGCGENWSTWVQTPRSPRLAKKHLERMLWIKIGLTSKDSLAMRPGNNDGQKTSVFVQTRQRGMEPEHFFMDLAGKQRIIKSSSQTANNPFHTTRNPMLIGFGIIERNWECFQNISFQVEFYWYQTSVC